MCSFLRPSWLSSVIPSTYSNVQFRESPPLLYFTSSCHRLLVLNSSALVIFSFKLSSYFSFQSLSILSCSFSLLCFVSDSDLASIHLVRLLVLLCARPVCRSIAAPFARAIFLRFVAHPSMPSSALSYISSRSAPLFNPMVS